MADKARPGQDILPDAWIALGCRIEVASDGREIPRTDSPPKRGRGRPPKAATSSAPATTSLDGAGEPAPWDEVGEGAVPSDIGLNHVDRAIVADCAGLDQSDTDNAVRLIRHCGNDMLVLQTEGAPSCDWSVWTGTHWDLATGNDAAIRKAQKIGALIVLEAEHLAPTPPERDLEARAARVRALNPKNLNDEERQALADAQELPKLLARRKASRRAFGVATKNQGRIINMLKMAAPHQARDVSLFNADPMCLAVKGHTLRFVRRVETIRELDPECPDPDVDRWIERESVVASVEAVPGHRREDYITKLMPVDYDPAATCPKWRGFLDEFLPSESVRRCVQVFSGLGITGASLQRVMFHYGAGANGKSVFLQTLMKLCGPLGADLPAASLAGESRTNGQQASPDLAMLQGARIVRVSELPADQPLKEELVKQLTGGEDLSVRNLFKGFFRFVPHFKAHLSGNGYPRIDGTDNGIWRRMTVIRWPVEVPIERRRELREVTEEFIREEGPGILNWLIEGVLIFLREGFIVPSEVQASTQDYRDEMDPIGEFLKDCVERVKGQNVQAKHMYAAYVSWSMANAKTPRRENTFGKAMKLKLPSKMASVILYIDCRLHDVPERPPVETDYLEQR